MKDFDTVIKFIDERLMKNDTVIYKAILKTSEDLDIWNVVVAHYSRNEHFNVKVSSSFASEGYEIMTLKIEALAW